jgi:hypothetical protein
MLLHDLKPKHPRAPLQEAVWNLVRSGLVFISFDGQNSFSNLPLYLTKLGREVAKETGLDPQNANEYMQQLDARVPALSDAVRLYTIEALGGFRSGSYLAAVVMLGVASEGAFLEMAEVFATWLPTNEAAPLVRVLGSPRSSYNERFTEFRKRVESHQKELPDEFADNMGVTLIAVADLLRVSRNEAGHPTGKSISRGDALTFLRIFPEYIAKMYALKGFCGSPRSLP